MTEREKERVREREREGEGGREGGREEGRGREGGRERERETERKRENFIPNICKFSKTSRTAYYWFRTWKSYYSEYPISSYGISSTFNHHNTTTNYFFISEP